MALWCGVSSAVHVGDRAGEGNKEIVRKIKHFEAEYPLAYTGGYGTSKQVLEYVNAVYLMRQGAHLTRLY
jgi:hypothetical protein